MQNFIIALCLLALTLAAAVTNSLLIGKQMQTLCTLAEQDEAAKAEEEFKRLEPYLALTVNHVVLETVQSAAEEMRVFSESAEPYAHTDYLAAKKRFLSGCAEICEGEKFSVSNIF